MAQSARSRAVTAANRNIDDSQARAVAARQEQRPSALAQMAQRLQVSQDGLRDTLMATAFKGASKEEFMALVIVSNTYGLNPLLKEIYGFPKRGGGIVPMVGLDGWIKLANEHPQFDGIEFDEIIDERGNIVGMEGILHRKDRTRPTKMMIHTDEFKVDSNPNWKSRERHMTWVRCFCQTVRVGLGLTGIGIEGDEMIDGGDVAPQRQSVQRLPSREELAGHDGDTGEVIDQPAKGGMTEVDEETARQLDAEQGYGDSEQVEREPEPEPEPEQAEDDAEDSEARKQVNAILERVSKAGTVIDLNTVEQDWTKKVRGGCEADMIELVEARIADRRAELKKGTGK